MYKKIFICTLIAILISFSFNLKVHSQNVNEQSIEFCYSSGGGGVKFGKYKWRIFEELVYSCRLRKFRDTDKLLPVSSHGNEFVEIERKTELSREHKAELFKLINKYNFKNIIQSKNVTPPDYGPSGSSNSLTLKINSESYSFNHHTIRENADLQNLIKELCEIAKKFTRIQDEK